MSSLVTKDIKLHVLSNTSEFDKEIMGIA
jgi:hypothetical protein